MKLTFKIIVFVVAMQVSAIESYAQNLLNLEGWTVGQGAPTGFILSGSTTENFREWGESPQGKRAIIWRAKPDGGNDADGGWNTAPFPIVHSNMYRFSVWLKKTNSNNGTSYLGCDNVLNLDNTANDNPYFWYGDLPELNKWYLLVGYVHGSGDNSSVSYGGIYDGVTGIKAVDITDFKFPVGATESVHRSYLYYDPIVNDEQFFYAPRVDLVNGNEPTITSLLGIQSLASAANLSYFLGKVGIKTPNPGNYDLAVNGKIRSQEIKVETANWPDYVFLPAYKVPTLQETEKHIKEKGHLPGIPSASDVKANGIDLGDMNAKLLQKIEELTLIIIDQNKRLENLENKSNLNAGKK
ncbi:hypothetical protein [Pedobacter frigoris]|uniref:LamG domain-containing protein n=1 Tax=Pedobacter frigoris TaxID=2571272 RepID=A0A4U1CJX8_9SPHI|nr:hypothetical protein [Pedobacter frigoris]TKC05246.1 hypothetical protein FA047_15940 [Pedobacter frigoris]